MKTSKLTILSITALLLAACSSEKTTISSSTAESASVSTSTQPATSTQPPIAGPITVYSGRNEKLIGPLLERFRTEKGIEVTVRYGDTAEIAGTLLEEGSRTPADVFFSQDASALGAVTAANMARQLPSEITSIVPAAFRSPDGRWVGVSGRARSIVYDPKITSVDKLAATLDQLADPKFKGKFGIAPTNASFQAHMAVYSALHGAPALEKLLKGIVANQPKRFANNAVIVQAVGAGEITFGVVNHYYVWQAKKAKPELSVANHFFSEGDGSGFVNVAGVAVLSDKPAALELVRFLLSDPSQQYFATETYEYPLVASVKPAVDLPPIETLKTPAIDFALASKALPGTLELINSTGLNRQ